MPDAPEHGRTPPGLSADWLAAHVKDASARGVREAVAHLITSGAFMPGDRLPTVSTVSQVLGLSRSTIALAWSHLKDEGYVETRRRGGTVVLAPPRRSPALPGNPRFVGWSPIELIWAHPDGNLVPPLDRALAVAVSPGRDIYAAESITPALREATGSTWPFRAAEFTALPGANYALRAMIEALGPASTIAVEEPTLLRTIGAVTDSAVDLVAVESDADGPTAPSLTRALELGAEAVIFQPRAGVPVGRMLTTRRRDELVEVLARRADPPWIIEDDSIGPLAAPWGRNVSLGERLPQQTVRLVTYWRSYGPDLEVTVVGGARAFMNVLIETQIRRGVRTGGMLQEALAFQLTDEPAALAVRKAASVYARRHAGLSNALAKAGVREAAPAGLFSWIPVGDEQRTVQHLATMGIHVVAGGRSYLTPKAEQHIRVAVTRLPDDQLHLEELASAIAVAIWGGHDAAFGKRPRQ